MSILMSNEIWASVKQELINAVSSVQIITAFCKQNAFEQLESCINSTVSNKRLLVRFRMDDILKGSTDFSIIEFGKAAGWQIFVRFDLHAKIYIVDNKRVMAGSANVTNSGLNLGGKGNLEMATLVDVEGKDIEKINKLFNDAILVNDDLLKKMKAQIEDVSLSEKKDAHVWDKTITSLFNPHIDTLFSYELPDETALIDGEYFSFLDETYDGSDKFKETFRNSKIYLWLLSTLKESDGCLYFGELTAKLHSVLVSDPKPYRKDIKQMLANLFKLIEELNMEEVIIDRPNYSQRIRLVDGH